MSKGKKNVSNLVSAVGSGVNHQQTTIRRIMKPTYIHWMTAGTVVLYIGLGRVMQGIFDAGYKLTTPNPELYNLLLWVFIALWGWTIITIASEVYVLVKGTKGHKIGAILLILLNIVITGYASYGFALMGVGGTL